MLDQENLYQLIFQEEWTRILNLLYTHKADIASDPMLEHAAKTFEAEFFTKVADYEVNRKDIEENLDILYVLNHGDFYRLSADNYKTLIIELVKRKPLKEAVNYAKDFPDDKTCKKAIEEFEKQGISATDTTTSTKTLPMNWIEIYNRIFELMNNQGDAATYFSGPRFINTVKEFEPYFRDYNQFIEQRNREGKSTSRKIFYYDILIELKEEIRLKVIDRILEILRPFQKEKVEKVQELLGRKAQVKNICPDKKQILQTNTTSPIVFISYSWDNEMHKEWVLNLADRLCSDGIDVILDRYSLKPGKNLPHFVENSISRAERIIIIFTPNYKLKADKRTGGVGYEYSIMNADLYNNQTTNDKIIPLLRAGGKEESIPTFMQQFIHIDSRNDENFENSYTDLLREIYNEPAIQKPQIGAKPIFSNKRNNLIEKPEVGKPLEAKHSA